MMLSVIPNMNIKVNYNYIGISRVGLIPQSLQLQAQLILVSEGFCPVMRVRADQCVSAVGVV